MKNNLIFYVGPFGFPNGGAAARRIYGNCLTLKKAGYRVSVISGQAPSSRDDSVFDYDGIEVHSVNERVHENKPTLIKHLLYLRMGSRTISYLNSLPEKPSVIILYSGYSPYLLNFIPWCKKNKIKLVFDAVEWYEPSRSLMYITPYYLNIEFAMRSLIAKTGNVITISNYLNNYYDDKGCNTLKIPPTLATDRIIANIGQGYGDVISLVYAGNPGRKEYLDVILNAIIILNENSLSFCLHVAGVDKEYFNKIYGSNKISLYVKQGFLFFHGKLQHEEAISLVRNSDFSVIIRPQTKCNNAGFPTKFVESLSVGTPVISTLTSDIEEYLSDGFNGFVCENSSVEELVKQLIKVKSLKKDKYLCMRENARETAVKYFDVNSYSKKIIKFLEM